jgi:hypothetical protein
VKLRKVKPLRGLTRVRDRRGARNAQTRGEAPGPELATGGCLSGAPDSPVFCGAGRRKKYAQTHRFNRVGVFVYFCAILRLQKY